MNQVQTQRAAEPMGPTLTEVRKVLVQKVVKRPMAVKVSDREDVAMTLSVLKILAQTVEVRMV